MKQIFTLLTALSITAAAAAQNINEGFNTSSEVTALATSCWNFNLVNFSASSPLAGTGSLVSQMGATASEIITPATQAIFGGMTPEEVAQLEKGRSAFDILLTRIGTQVGKTQDARELGKHPERLTVD